MSGEKPDRIRRAMLGVAAGGVAASALAAPVKSKTAASEDDLLKAFAALLDPVTRDTMLAENAIVIDGDAPLPMTRAEHLDHLAFHRPLWESRELHCYDLQISHAGEAAIVSAYLMDRGKPRNAGFRIRPTYCTAVLARTTAGWRAISLHLGPLSGQLTNISPG